MGDKERYTLFYGIQSPFSQFHPSKFTIDGVMYRCAEQYGELVGMLLILKVSLKILEGENWLGYILTDVRDQILMS